jgi:Autotransporter beta-domain/CHRD domain
MNCLRRAMAIRCASLLLAFIGAACLLVPASHAELLFVTTLVGSNEVPPTGSAGTGAAVVVINPAASTMSVGVNFSGLGSGTTASHIHCCLSFPFQANNNVMVATTTPTFPGFPLGVTAGNYAMTFNLLNPASYNPAFITSAFNPSGTVAGADAALVSGIAAGETYLNIHTTNFPGGEIRGFLIPVSGEAVTGAQQGAFQIMTEFLTLMMDPFVYGRTGFGGSPELAPAYAPVYKEPAARRALAPFEQRWTVWGGGYGATSRTTGDPIGIGSHDLSASTGGGAAGLDYQLSPYTVVGFALGGGATNWSVAQGLGGGHSDVFQVGVYGITNFGPAYLAASFGYAEHWMRTNREVFGLETFATDFNAHSYGGRAEAGYHLGWPVFTVTPYAAVQAQAFHIPSLIETDVAGTGLGFAFAGRTPTDTRSELGARFERAVALGSSTLLALRAKVAWAHDWVSDPVFTAAFQMLPTASFLVSGATPPTDLALVSAGGELRFANRWALLAKFDGEFASHSSTYGGTGTIRYSW